MKIIGVSNFDDEMVSDVLVKKDIYGVQIIDELEKLNKDSEQKYFYKAVDDNYKLYEFKP